MGALPLLPNATVTTVDAGQNHCIKVADGAGYLWRDPHHLPFELFLFQGTIMLSLSSLLYVLLKPFKQPIIVSQIVAGIMLGPSLLRHSKKLEAIIFPPGDGGVLYTISLMGVYYFLFVEGVKVDISTIPKLSRKVIQIAFAGLIPHAVTMSLICHFKHHLLPANVDKMFFLKFLALTNGISFFPTLQPILAEFRLLNTHLGRLSMDVSMVHLIAGAIMFMINQVIAQGYNDPLKGLKHFISVIALWVFFGCFFRPVILRIMRRTPEGRLVKSNYTVAVILLVLVVAFISNVIGATVFQGVLIMALLVPPGPPLGLALVRKIELIGRVIFFPVYFIIAGSRVDLFNSGSWGSWCVMGAILFTSWFAKLVGIIGSAVYFKIPMNDAIALAFASSTKGLIELVILAFWYNVKMIDNELIAILTVTNVIMTSISAPILAKLAQRSKETNSWSIGCRARSIQQHFTTASNSELRILACVRGQDDVPSLLTLLNLSHPTTHRPICLYLLQLLDLAGRGAPIFMPYKPNSSKKNSPGSILDHMLKAIQNRMNNDCDSNTNILVQPFVSVSPHKTMHQDVCSLAHDKFVSVLIMPFNYAHPDSTRLVAKNVLQVAPCSVGLLVNSLSFCSAAPIRNSSGLLPYHIGVVFFGGADDREALSYVGRIAEHPSVRVIALRCNMPSDNRRSSCDADWETVEDENMVCEFRRRTAAGGCNVHYKEVNVSSVENIVAAIASMGTCFDLMVVGRSHNRHSSIIDALSAWNSSTAELGAVGDYLASPDFNQKGIPVLVMQQHKETRSLRTIHSSSITIEG